MFDAIGFAVLLFFEIVTAVVSGPAPKVTTLPNPPAVEAPAEAAPQCTLDIPP